MDDQNNIDKSNDTGAEHAGMGAAAVGMLLFQALGQMCKEQPCKEPPAKKEENESEPTVNEWTKNLISKVEQMRNAQNMHRMTRDAQWIQQCMDLEKEVDEMIQKANQHN